MSSCGSSGSPTYCASIGPAADGRVKPDLVGFFDCIRTTSSCNYLYSNSFGGTSAAAPIVCGHVGLLMEMWADDADANIIFGSTLDEKLIDQMKITVIATGFDEARMRLANMVTRSRPMAPSGMAGIVSEKPKVVEPEPEPESFTPPDQAEPMADDWDIPAFLRQGR